MERNTFFVQTEADLQDFHQPRITFWLQNTEEMYNVTSLCQKNHKNYYSTFQCIERHADKVNILDIIQGPDDVALNKSLNISEHCQESFGIILKGFKLSCIVSLTHKVYTRFVLKHNAKLNIDFHDQNFFIEHSEINIDFLQYNMDIESGFRKTVVLEMTEYDLSYSKCINQKNYSFIKCTQVLVLTLK